MENSRVAGLSSSPQHRGICVAINQCVRVLLGQEPQIRRIEPCGAWRTSGRRCSSRRHRCALASDFDFHTVVIYVGDVVGILQGHADVTQHVFVTHAGEKDRLLAECVRKEVQAARGQACRIIVFAN